MTLLYSMLDSLSIIWNSTVSLWPLSICIILLYSIRRCITLLVLKGTASIRLASQWYTIIMYCFTLWSCMGKQPVSSVYNLLIGVTWINSLFNRTWVIGSSVALGGGVLGLVDLTPWSFGTRCTILVASADEKYLVALASVSLGYDA